MTLLNGSTYPRVTEILKITDTEVGSGTYDVQIKIQWQEGGEPELIGAYRSAPYDTSPINAQLRQWMIENPDAPVHVYVPPPPPTQEEIRAAMPKLSSRQFRLGLVEGGFTPAQVTAAIEAMQEGADKEKAKIEWEYATEFQRAHPLITSVAAALGLDDNEIDAMWNAAINL